jgi:hypothetical protein
MRLEVTGLGFLYQGDMRGTGLWADPGKQPRVRQDQRRGQGAGLRLFLL